MSGPAFPREHREDRGPGSHYHEAIQKWHDDQERDRVIRERMRAASPRRHGLGVVIWLLVVIALTALTISSCARPDSGEESAIAGLSVAQAVYTPRPVTHWEAYQAIGR